MNEIIDHLKFFEPDINSDILQRSNELPKDWMKVFYIARCLFSSNSSFPIKGHLAPLLERKDIFSNDCIKKENDKSETIVKSNMSESINIGRITSVHQISHILPREFIINLEEVFYKKLINRELYKKEFNTPEGYSVSELVNGRESELNKKQKVYILFDNSYSMNGEKFNKIFTAKAICLEYLKNVQKENPQIYFRYFNQAMGPLLRIRKQGQIKDLIKYIISVSTALHYETGTTSRSPFLHGTVAVRLHDLSGRPLGYCGRYIDQKAILCWGKWRFPKKFPKSNILYNAHRAVHVRKHGIIVVECPWAVMRLGQAGINNAVALLGTNISPAQIAWLSETPKVLLLLDGDRPGRKAASAIAYTLRNKTNVFIHYLPEGMEPEDFSDKELASIVNKYFYSF
jgi:5S rRNA maturation endonuclease (ribonuclease M5)